MKLYLRIAIFLVSIFALISAFSILTFLYSLKSSQTDNLVSFRNEFVELSRELFQKTAGIFYDYLDYDIGDNKIATTSDAVVFLKTIDPADEDLLLIDLSSKKFVAGFDNPNMTPLLDVKTIGGFYDQWILNQKSDFEVDNYNEFLAGQTSLAPIQINLRFYKNLGLIVGYGKVFETAKVRIDFIKKKNQQYYESLMLTTTTFFIILAVLVAGLSIFFMKRNIINPIIKLKQATIEIGKGNLSAKIAVKSKSEIGELATSFNLMAKKLSASRIDIEGKIKELSTEHGKLSSLVESVKLGILMVDLNLNVILSNSAAKKILGKSPEEKVSFNDLSEKIKKNLDISKALSYYVKAGRPFNIQEVIIDEKHYRFFMSPVRDIVERIFVGAVLVMEDITEEKKLEKMRKEIISITSHQLRTPATIVKGNLEMIKSGDFGAIPEGQKDLIDDTYLGNQRMIKLINDLMDVAKIDEGKFEIELEPTQLENIVADVVKEVVPLAKEKNVSLSYDYPSKPLAPVKINRQRVAQVIQNLIDNAIKYSSVGDKGTVKVELHDNIDVLEFTVKDNGIGIPENEQGKMFQRFSRGSNSTKLDPGGGSGLGLYIAKAVVEQRGGKIWFESKEDEGTTFHATFPHD